MKRTVLLTGGTGLIGTYLSDHLANLGFEVRILTRNVDQASRYTLFHWDIEKNQMDSRALENLDVIIALAGASIASKAWTEERREVLYKSRVYGNQLLLDTINKTGSKPSLFIGTSAVGIYGDRGDEILNEESKPGKDSFMVNLCLAWEDSVFAFKELDIRVGAVRVGLVLSDQGGVLPTLKNTTFFGIGSYLGSGAQYMPWIHIEDLAQIFSSFIEHPTLSGIVNGVGPDPATNKEFMQTLVNCQGGLKIVLPAPAFAIKLVMGSRAALVLNSNRVISSRLEELGYQYHFQTLESAILDNLK